jgi:hypothetical protein
MRLRLIGRWLYHTITSAEKRPYIKLTLEDLELLTAKAAGSRDILLFFGVLDELKYRVTSPGRRDKLTKRILSLLQEYEGISISPDAERGLITKARSAYLREVDQKATEEKRKKTSEARATREAEAKAKRKDAERKEAERKAKEAAAEQERLEAEAKAQRVEAERKEAERKAKEAAAEHERLEAEAKAQRVEAERKEAERKAKEAAAEQERLEAEAKAQQVEAERKEAERKAKEAAAEQERLEAEAKAQRVEAERKEAERKAKEAATEQERLEAEAKAQRVEAERKEAERKAKEAATAAEQERLEAKAKAQREEVERKEAERKAKEAAAEQERLEAESKAEREKAERKAKEAAAEQERLEAKAKAKREEAERKEAERKAKEAAAEKTRLEAEVRLMPDQELNSSRQLEEQAEADAKLDEASESDSKTPLTKGITRRLSRKEEREDRRELARLRWLERKGKTADRSEDELVEADLDAEVEPAEEFAPFLREIPAHWSNWSEQHWNIKLLEYCFVQQADANSGQGIPSTEEDLAFMTGDRETSPDDIAQALVDRVREFSVNRGLSPARLLINRLEKWDHKSPNPPRYFSFLWTTCLIAQGFPCPFEQGEFHRRYARDDVYGSNESQYLSSNLPAAWAQLSQWLDRDDIFDCRPHRRLVLPKTDPRRSIISHSWKLSFPCRSDRKKLHELLGKVKKGNTSPASADLQLIPKLLYQGGFTPEFTAALKQQFDLVQKGNKVEEWLSAIIQREIEAQGISQTESARHGKPKDVSSSSSMVMLHLDEKDCYLELVLPRQSIAIEKPRRLSYKTYCAINLEAKDKLPQLVSELDIDKKHDDMIIPDLRVKIESEDEEYVLRLRHEGLDSAVLAEWSCEGLPSNKHYILFDSETNQIINDGALIGNSLYLLFRRDWDVALSDGIEAETEEPRRVSRLGGWRYLELAKTSPPEKSETISLTNVTGEECEVCWVEPGAGNSNSRPLLKGLGLPGQANRFVMLAESPELWLPPAVTEAEIEMYKIEDVEFFMHIGSIQVSSNKSWQQAGVRRLIAGPGLYSVKLSYFDDLNERARKWSRQFLIAEEPDIKSLHTISLQARYSYKDRLKVLDLERDVSPLVFQETPEFWNAEWLIHGLWAHEKIRIRLDGDGESHSPFLSADNTGSCNILISAFEPYLLSKESARLSIQRQGFICQYDLAVLIGSSSNRDQATREEQRQPTAELRKRPAQRRRTIDTVDLVVNGGRSYEIQKMIVDKLNDLIKEHLGHLESWAIDYPDGKKAPGRRFVFHKVSFAGMENDAKEKFGIELDSMISSIGREYGLAFSAEWSRARE